LPFSASKPLVPITYMGALGVTERLTRPPPNRAFDFR
jgi:hypothetical protein